MSQVDEGQFLNVPKNGVKSMQLRTPVTVDAFLKEISGPDGSIDLSSLRKIGGGGTHDIFRSEKHPQLLLKVMKHTVGKEEAELAQNVMTLGEQYALLYRIFGSSRCIIENRAVQSIKKSKSDKPEKAIVSVVPFDECFESKEKFGFNVKPAEADGQLIASRRYLYQMVSRSLMGKDQKPSPYVMKGYTELNKNFEGLFKLLDTDKSFAAAMKGFLQGYRDFYQKSGILLDTIGLDNVLFYKKGDQWQFKLGSVIKHDTGALTKKMLDEINKNPSVVKGSFKAITSIFFMPACIKALNACGEKVGMGRIIEDIVIDEKTINILAKMHLQLDANHHIMNLAEHGKFSKALELFNQYVKDEKDYDTRLRDTMGTSYWEYIKKGGKESSREEVEVFLKMLSDERNQFPDVRKKIVEEAVEGLKAKISSLDSKEQKAAQKTPAAEKDVHEKKTGETDKEYVARLGKQTARMKKT